MFDDCKGLEEKCPSNLPNHSLCPVCTEKVLSSINVAKTEFTREQYDNFLLAASEFDNFEVVKVILCYVTFIVINVHLTTPLYIFHFNVIILLNIEK